jgi:hypothetical protein
MDYKRKHSHELPSDTSLPDELNYFYARFEASNTEACMRTPAVLDDCVITVSVTDVSKTFKQVNIHKAAGLGGLPGRVLRACADQLASVAINTIIPETLYPIQFAYRPNRSTDETISIALHTALSHLNKRKI